MEESTMTKLRSLISLAGSQEVSERKQTNETLLASEHDLHQIINTIPALAWSTHPDGSAEFFNRLYISYAVLSLQQLQGWVYPRALSVRSSRMHGLLFDGQQENSKSSAGKLAFMGFPFPTEPFEPPKLEIDTKVQYPTMVSG
jgi:hypothetical protein